MTTSAANTLMPPVGLNPSAVDTDALAALIVSSGKVLPWLQDWTLRAMTALRTHGWHCSASAVEDEMSLGIDVDERSWTLGADIWDLSSESSYRLTLELATGVTPDTAGRTSVRIRLGGGPRNAAGLIPVLREEELLCCTSRPGPLSCVTAQTLGDWAAHVHGVLQRWSDVQVGAGDPDLNDFARDFDLQMQM